MNGDNDDKGFLLQLQMRAEQKANELTGLMHERQLLDVKIERTKSYIEQLNAFLAAEGLETIHVRVLPQGQGNVGRPGNRSKALPLRKGQWEGKSLNDIIALILNSSPGISFHPKEVAPLIYEIQTPADVNMVMKNVRSTMQRGARDGKWDKTGRAKFQAKVTEQQGKLVPA